MDPMHGEISRAMRNRGIEIYVPGDGDENSLDPHDMKLLLHGLGLSGNNVCDALVAVHTEAKTSIVGETQVATLFHIKYPIKCSVKFSNLSHLITVY